MVVTAVEQTLRQLAALAWRDRLSPLIYAKARELTDRKSNRQQKMDAIVVELHRRYGFRPDPSEAETLDGSAHMRAGHKPIIDADDACLVVAGLAMSVSIRCRFVAARYDQSWTCWVAYEVGDHWETIDPLRQRPEREPDELLMGSMPDEVSANG